ncbi:MAG: hypothetical protein IPM54_14275 [Polyangiaceae bacterium]|nr:hypothetical protein [Polyangiaceae bacterium]
MAICDALALAWEPLAALTALQDVGFHSATKLDSGELLVVGGATVDMGLFNGFPHAASEYDEETNVWTPLDAPTHSYALHTATKLRDGRVLVAGGLLGSMAELFDPVAKTWQATDPLPRAIMSATATLLNDGRVLHVGGVYSTGTAFTAHEVLLYDVEQGTWETLPDVGQDLPKSRFGHTATLLDDDKDDEEDDNEADDNVFVVGGAEITGSNLLIDAPTKSAALFDPVDETWTAVTPMNIARAFHTATRLSDGRILVAGGGVPKKLGPEGSSVIGIVTWGNVYSSAEIYDPVTNTWTLAGNMNEPRAEHQAVLLENGRVLVAGGKRDSSGRMLASAEIFDPVKMTWTTTSHMQTPRFGHSLALLDRGVVATGGILAFSGINRPPERYPQAPDGTFCTFDDQCKSTHCVDGVCCDSACSSPCLACKKTEKNNKALDDGICEDVSGCTPFACNVDNGLCGTSCATIEECASGHVCDPTGTCIRPLENASIIDDSSCAASLPQSNAPPWPGLTVVACLFAWRRQRSARKDQRKS